MDIKSLTRYIPELAKIVDLTDMEYYFARGFMSPRGLKLHPEVDFIKRTGARPRMPLTQVKLGRRDDEIGATIVYDFSSNIRHVRFSGGRQYGAEGFSFRLLYEFLCQIFNGGEYFIDTYFNEHFEETAAYTSYKSVRDTVLKKMAEEVQARKSDIGRWNLRDTRGRFISAKDMTAADWAADFARAFTESGGDVVTWREGHLKERLSEVAEMIREDIVAKLSTGAISLVKRTLEPETVRKRQLAGLNTEEIFYASGQLIKDLSIYVMLDTQVEAA